MRFSFSVLLILSLLPCVFLNGQVDTVWVRRWTSPGAESDWAYALALDNTGHCYVTGKTNNAGTNDDWTTIKYLPDGDTAWIRNFVGAGSANERASSIAIGPSDNVYITGYTMSSSAGDYLTIKYHPDGDTAWTRRYNGTGDSYDFANWICVDNEENVYVTGYSRGLSYQNDIVTVKYDSSGTQQWVARFNGAGNYNDEGYKVIADNNGYVYVAGTANPYSSGTRYDCVTIKYDAATGDTAWVRTYNSPVDSTDIARDIEVDAEGNVYVTGSSRNAGTYGDIITIQYDSLGVEQWAVLYNNPDTSGNDAGYGIEVGPSGAVYVAGQSQGYGTGMDIVVLKYDPAGTFQWASRYNGLSNDYDTPSDQDGGKCMAIDQYENIYVVGCSRSATTWYDFITLAFNSDSTLKWAATYNSCDSTDWALAVATDDSGNVYTAGRSIGLNTYYDMATVKYWSQVSINESKQYPVHDFVLDIAPNPCRNTARIVLPGAHIMQNTQLRIYDITGRLIKSLAVSSQNAAQPAVVYWDATNSNDEKVAPGVYFCVVDLAGDHLQKKIVLVK
jgi:hypothetical protein